MGAKKRKTRLNRIGQEMRREVSSKGAASRLAWMKFSHVKGEDFAAAFSNRKNVCPGIKIGSEKCAKPSLKNVEKCVDKF